MLVGMSMTVPMARLGGSNRLRNCSGGTYTMFVDHHATQIGSKHYDKTSYSSHEQVDKISETLQIPSHQ